MPYDAGLAARMADCLESIGERRIRQRNVFGGRGNAISEVLADSHDPSRAPGPSSSLDEWDPAHA